MTLLGLAALVVGGIGVANGVEAWLTARARTIATLRCLGASARLIGLIYGTQLLLLGVPGILLGLAVGAGCTVAGSPAAARPASIAGTSRTVPRAVRAGLYLRPACGPHLCAPPLAPRHRHLGGRFVPAGRPAGARAGLMAGERGASVRGARLDRAGSTFRAEALHRFGFLRRYNSHLGVAARHCGAVDAPAAFAAQTARCGTRLRPSPALRPGFIPATYAAFGRCWTDRAGGGGRDPWQSRGRVHRRLARQCAEFLLHRHPARRSADIRGCVAQNRRCARSADHA